jgi:serine/threonine protein phosphatase 1
MRTFAIGTVIRGHSAQRSGRITDLGHTICLDTNIADGGWLTCLSLDNFEYWQADRDGQSRSGYLREPTP